MNNHQIKIAIALGGNIGDVSNTFLQAITKLKENGLIDIVFSSLHSNPAVSCIPDTPDFTNAALTALWGKTPEELLELCQKIETEFGRPKIHSSNQSRVLDLDIILYGNLIINKEYLQIPHPRAHKRSFVLIPLAEIAPDWIFPTENCTIKDLISNLN